MRMKEVDKIAFVEINNGKILSTKSKGVQRYYIPGGKRELGETITGEAISKTLFHFTNPTSYNLMRLIFNSQRTLHLHPAVNLNSNYLTKKCRGLSPCLLPLCNYSAVLNVYTCVNELFWPSELLTLQ